MEKAVSQFSDNKKRCVGEKNTKTSNVSYNKNITIHEPLLNFSNIWFFFFNSFFEEERK